MQKKRGLNGQACSHISGFFSLFSSSRCATVWSFTQGFMTNFVSRRTTDLQFCNEDISFNRSFKIESARAGDCMVRSARRYSRSHTSLPQ